MNLADVFQFVQEHKFWLAVAVPVVVAIIVIKILG